MEYFEVMRPYGDGSCSDPACPCGDTVIPRGTGYVYISQDVVDFRQDCRTEEEINQKVMNLRRQGTFVVPQNLAVPVLVCEQGAKRRNIDLEIGAADAKYWWETGKIPLRATPKAGGNSKNDGCFIATVAFGSPLSSEVEFLRSYRDDRLSQYVAGRLFINLYYQFGPSIAKGVSLNRILLKSTRLILSMLCQVLKKYQ